MARLDQEAVLRHARTWIANLSSGVPEGATTDAELLAYALRNMRDFKGLGEFVSDAARHGVRSPMLVRLEAQAMIETGDVVAAIALLSDLGQRIPDTDPEARQALGLIGRCYKQVFLDRAASAPHEAAAAALRMAIRYYSGGLVLATIEHPDYLWLAMNVAALAHRAEFEGIEPPFPVDWRALAEQIDKVVAAERDAGRVTAWNCATAGEACLALGDAARAAAWFELYAARSDSSAFALHSTLRQLRDVWRIDPDRGRIGRLYSLLQARLIMVEQGEVDLDPKTVAAFLAERDVDSDQLARLLAPPRNRRSATAEASGGAQVPERVFNDGAFEEFSSLMIGVQRARSIARIGRDARRGTGTGFLVRGGDFIPALGNERVLLTNAHVLTHDFSHEAHHHALSRGEALVTFTAADEHRHYRIRQILWTSPFDALDATLARLDPEPPPELVPLPVAPVLPRARLTMAERHRVYIFGHPGGGALQLSLHENDLLEHNCPDEHERAPALVQLRYLTPTMGGSSGSPVFFGRDWQVIGLHHAAGVFAPLLGQGPDYEANQAIWVQSIAHAARRETAR
ncbi:MAG: hypothetical protein GC150_02960 [Rhizobiales bacterium]|nr:hypothetical protein [Hyphomicrobiales bacterium]